MYGNLNFIQNEKLYFKAKQIEEETGKKLLNFKEVADYLHCGDEEVRALLSCGSLNSVEPSGSIFRTLDIAAFELGIINRGLDFTLTSALPSAPLIIEDIDAEEFEMIKKKHGIGSVYWNESRNCWQAAFYVLEDGEKKRKIISAQSSDEVYLKMAQLRSGKMAFVSEDEIPKPKELHTVTAIWNFILENMKRPVISDGTYKWYKNITKPMITQLGDVNIEELTSAQIIDFINSLRYTAVGELASESRIKKATEQLKLVISYSMSEGYIIRNPYNLNVRRPRGVERDPRETALNMDEVAQLLGHIRNTKSDMMKTLIPALLLSGLRINEFLALKYSDLDRETGTIYVHEAIHLTYNKNTGKRTGRDLGNTKTEASVRKIPVPPIFFDIIDNWHNFVYENPRRVEGIEREGTQDIIFTGIDGKIRADDTTRSRCAGYLKEWGLKKPNTTFHGFRRTYATLAYEAGAEMETISMLLGHKPDVKDGCEVAREHYIYIRDEFTNQKMKEAVEKFYDYVGSVFEENIELKHLKSKK